MNFLIDLMFGCKNFMSKYLDLYEEELWFLLVEYFGVVLVFVVLGVLICGMNGNRVKEDVKDSSVIF